MKFGLKNLFAAAGLACVSFVSNAYAQTADLKVTFVYDSDTLPKPAEINMAKDPWCAENNGQPVYEDKLVINPSTKGIKNIVIYPDAKKSGLTVKDADQAAVDAAKKGAVLDNVKCVFEPHVFAAVAGGSITVKNSDSTGHNASFSFFANAAANQIVPQGGQVSFDVKQAERAPIPVECNIHPWMKAYVVVSETPFVGISNENGEILIKGLPAEKEIVLKVWHENSEGAIAKVNLDGKEVEWKKGVMELKLKPGLNDLASAS